MNLKCANRWLASAAVAVTVAGSSVALGEDFAKPLPLDDVTGSAVLPSPIPPGWIFIFDINPTSLVDGRVLVIDPEDAQQPVRGRVRSAQFGSFRPNPAANELYTSETFYSRLTRGDRTDVLTVWDAKTLEPTREVVLPSKRGQISTSAATLALTSGGKLGLVWNFTPASSVSVIDLTAAKVLGEVDTAGCSLIYPTGARGFYTLCGDGALTSIQLDAAGQQVGKQTSVKFNSIDSDPLFMEATRIEGIDYFASFLGRVQPIDARRAEAVVLPAWSLVTPEEAEAGWRPSGAQIATHDAQGRLYVIMQAHGQEGSHKSGGGEVWVFDVAGRVRLKRISLKHPARGIQITAGPTPRLVAIAADGGFDVYDAQGRFQHSLAASLVGDATIMWAAR